MEYEKLTYLGIKELYPHPDNPRLDIGDITELVESVRANGILQNLTVIPGRKGTPEEMEEILAERRRHWQKKPVRFRGGVLRLFSELAASPMKGAYLDYDARSRE